MDFGTKFDLNFNFGTILKDHVCRSYSLVPKLVCAEINEMIYMSRISILKKLAENSYLGCFWGEKSRGANDFSI